MKLVFITLIMLFIIVGSNLLIHEFNCNSILMNEKSQFNQDLSLHYHFFQNFFNGFFIELGANDGIKFSNTYFFEKNLGWNGILIEGGKENCNKLYANSKIRSNSIIVCAAICYSKHVYFNDDGLNGKIVQVNKGNYEIKCNTLKNITTYYKIKHINLFSLDVEGSELEVLKTFDFNVKVDQWLIEWNHLNSDTKENISSLLNSHGYYINRKVHASHIDIVFSRKDK